MRTHLYRIAQAATDRALLAALLYGVTTASAFAQLVDLRTTPIPGSRDRAHQHAVAQVQSQIPQPIPDPSASQAVPIQPTPIQPTPIPAPNQLAPPQLNVDPNANINDLMPPATTPAPAPQNFNRRRASGLGATAGSYSSAPNMIGDLFGGSFSTFGGSQTVAYSLYAPGTILAGSPGGSGSSLGFEVGLDTIPDDIFTSGPGTDMAGADGFADTFAIAEPLPPNDAPTSPGSGFIFDGGTAVYTNNDIDTTAQPGIYMDGEKWYIAYSYSQHLSSDPHGEAPRPVPGPGVAARRVKLAENSSPEVRDRCFASYNFFNDAYGGLGDVSRYTLGLERILVDQLISFEARLLMAGTYGSTQVLENAPDRNFEFGNCALIGKSVLLRTDRFLWSGGLGLTLPTADDTRIRQGGQDVLVVKNRTVHLLPFMAMLLRKSRNTSFQAYMQLDIAANGDSVYGDLTGGTLPRIGVFNDSTLMNIDVAMSHVVYRDRCRRMLREVIANGELHYTGTLQDSDYVSSGGLTYTNLAKNFNVVNATAGCHLVLSNNVVVTPAMSVPLRSGLDKQFDYEAIVQLNYLR